MGETHGTGHPSQRPWRGRIERGHPVRPFQGRSVQQHVPWVLPTAIHVEPLRGNPGLVTEAMPKEYLVHRIEQAGNPGLVTEAMPKASPLLGEVPDEAQSPDVLAGTCQVT